MIDQNYAQNQPAIIQRPTLLTVLCILTFIGSGWGLISGVINIFTAKTVDTVALTDQMSTEMEKLNDSGAAGETATKIMEGTMDMVGKAAENAIPLAIVSMIASALAIFGAYLMWNLSKKGFYIYVIAQIISLIGIFVLLGVNLISVMFIGLGGFLALVFVILYAVNLKYMR
jgi:hypothetical protein